MARKQSSSGRPVEQHERKGKARAGKDPTGHANPRSRGDRPFEIADPKTWTLPDPKAVIRAMYRPTDRVRRESWIFTSRIRSVDLYSYLKYRFGEPNGFAMTLRSPSVDNFIHWNFTIASGSAILDVRGLDLHTELTVYSPGEASAPEWVELERRLLQEFERHREDLKKVRGRFERWSLFTNPHCVIRMKLERQVRRLRALDLDNVSVPGDPRSAEELPQYQEELERCKRIYQEAMALSIDIQLSAPVFGESAVNLLTLLLAKAEIKSDRRLFDEQARRPIDVRVKSLHLVCDGFSARIDGSEEPFKNFLRLMNRRNDLLHGNVDPRKRSEQELYFDHRFIPLFTGPHGMTQLALKNALADVDPHAAVRDWDVARGFVDLLMAKLEGSVRKEVKQVFAQQQLGYRPKTGLIGVILPQMRIGLVPGKGPTPRGSGPP